MVASVSGTVPVSAIPLEEYLKISCVLDIDTSRRYDVLIFEDINVPLLVPIQCVGEWG